MSLLWSAVAGYRFYRVGQGSQRISWAIGLRSQKRRPFVTQGKRADAPQNVGSPTFPKRTAIASPRRGAGPLRPLSAPSPCLENPGYPASTHLPAKLGSSNAGPLRGIATPPESALSHVGAPTLYRRGLLALSREGTPRTGGINPPLQAPRPAWHHGWHVSGVAA